MQKPKIIMPKYEVTTFLDGNTTLETMSRSEVLALNPQGVDHLMDFAFGLWGYRNSQGKWFDCKTPWRGLGNTCVRIIQAVQIVEGEHLTPGDIAELTGIPGLCTGNNLAARWMAIRKAHSESALQPHFFLSSRTGGHTVAWNTKYSWRWIERIKTQEVTK